MSVDLTVSPFATVTGRVYRDYGVSDGPEPDAVPGSGYVVFTPVLLAGEAAPVGVPQAQRVMAPIDPATGVVGPVLLWAGSWQVHVSGATMPGEVVLEAGQSYDLATLRGYVPGPGVSVTTLEVPAPSGPGYLSTDGTTLSWSDAVDSVNGQTGTVVLGAADVGAEPAGSMVAHMGAADPHPQYLTPTEGDGRYLPASYSPPAPDLSGYVQTTDARLSDARTPIQHTHPWADVTGKPATYPPAAHTHTVADLTDGATLTTDAELAAGLADKADANTVPTLSGTTPQVIARPTTFTGPVIVPDRGIATTKIATTGASNGQALVFDAAANAWTPGSVSSGLEADVAAARSLADFATYPRAVGGVRTSGGDALATTPAKQPGVLGTDYSYMNPSWLKALHRAGVRRIRISSTPSRTRGSRLADYMAAVGAWLDMSPDTTVQLAPYHCYGCDSDGTNKLVLGAGWSVSAAASQWAAIVSHSTVAANQRRIDLDLMNEPNATDMGISESAIASLMPMFWQASVDAVRAAGFTGWIWCQPGMRAAAKEISTSVPSWTVTDALKRTGLAVHYYFDNMGAYTDSYANEVALAQEFGWANISDKTENVIELLTAFRRVHGVEIIVNEVGWPMHATWDAEGRHLLRQLNRHRIGWMLDSVSPAYGWMSSVTGANAASLMDPFSSSDSTPSASSSLDLVRPQGRALLDYQNGAALPPPVLAVATSPGTGSDWPGGVNWARNPRAVSGGAAWTGLVAWSNSTPTYVTGLTGWANGTTTGARMTIATANSSGGNGLQSAGTILGDTVPVGTTLPVSVQMTRSTGTALRLEVGWLDRAGSLVGGNVTVNATATAAGAVTNLTATSPPRPGNGRRLRVSALAPSASAGEVVTASNLAMGPVFADGTTSGWVWTGAANASASRQV